MSRQSTQDYSDGPIRDINGDQLQDFADTPNYENMPGYPEDMRNYPNVPGYDDPYNEGSIRDYHDGPIQDAYGYPLQNYNEGEYGEGSLRGSIPDYEVGSIRGYNDSVRYNNSEQLGEYGDRPPSPHMEYSDNVMLDIYERATDFEVPSPARIRWIEAFNKVRAQLSEVG
jgi:hypothetical protein